MDGGAWSKGGLVMTGKKLKYWERILSHCHISHQKSDMDWSGNKTELPISHVRNTPTDNSTALAVRNAARTIIMKQVVLHQLDNAR